jgi:surfactin synthase thioesterase subunit
VSRVSASASPAEHRVTLFCLASAGATASTQYAHWQDRLGPTVQVLPLDLPGRGRRVAAPAMTDMAGLLDDLGARVVPATDRPWAVFGHSFGAQVAHELVRHLTDGCPAPMALFVSGRAAPHLTVGRSLTSLTDEDLLKLIARLGGLPAGLVRHVGVSRSIVQAVRADLAISDKHPWIPGPPLSCPVTALAGCTDPLVRVKQLYAWQDLVAGQLKVHVLSGGHFYDEGWTDVLRLVEDRLHGHELHDLVDRTHRSG